MAQKNQTYWIAGIIIIGILILKFGNLGFFSTINCPQEEPIRYDSWNNFDVMFSSAYFGTATYPNSEIYSCGEQGGSTTQFKVSNHYNLLGSGELKLDSSYSHITGSSFDYGKENWIKAEIDVDKPGIFTFDYYTAGSGYADHNGKVKINSQYFSGTGTYVLNATDSQIIEVMLSTYAWESGVTSSYAEVTISFEGEIECLTSADANCDGIIDRSELGVSITKFLTGTLSRQELGEIIQGWASQ